MKWSGFHNLILVIIYVNSSGLFFRYINYLLTDMAQTSNLQKIQYKNAGLFDSQAFTALSSLFDQGLSEYPIHIAISVAFELLQRGPLCMKEQQLQESNTSKQKPTAVTEPRRSPFSSKVLWQATELASGNESSIDIGEKSNWQR